MRAPPPLPPGLYEQMLADWAAVGLRRLEVHLARHAAFCEFLRDRRADGDPRDEPVPRRETP